MLFLLDSLAFALFLYLAWAVGYLFFFAFAGVVRPQAKHSPDRLVKPTFKRIAVLIPAYKEDAVIVDTARCALEQIYPRSAFEVFVIADSLHPDTLDALSRLPIRVLPVAFAKSTKAKALNAALERLHDTFDIALLLDADNVMDPHVLAHINAAFGEGAQVVQAQRVAKNTDTPLAHLDALSEHINNHIFRKGHQAVGLSAALIGSGMAVDYHLFKRHMADVHAVGGFDKELELRLLQEGVRFTYCEDALVYDEKVSHPDTFVNQRTRWLAAQGHYLKRYFGRGLCELFRSGNVDFFDKTLQLVLPPRTLLIAALPVASGLSLVVPLGASTWSWLTLCVVMVWTLLLAMPRDAFNASLLQPLRMLPRGIWLMLRALRRSPTGNRTFLHTPHHMIPSTLQTKRPS